jgi:MFS family permease
MPRVDSMAPSATTVALTGFLSLAVAMGIGRFAFTPILPMMQSGAGLSISSGAWLASANYTGYLVGALSAIGLRLAVAHAIRAGLLTIALTTLAVGLTHNFALWVFLRVLTGFASAWVLVFVSAWCLDALSRLARPALAGVVFAGVGFGITGAGILCVYLVGSDAPWEDAWIALGLAALAATTVMWRVLGRASVGGESSATRAAKPGQWVLVLAYAAFGFGYSIPSTFIPALAKQQLADPVFFALFWPLFGLAAFASTVVVARLASTAAYGRRLWLGVQLVMAVSVILPLILRGVSGIGLSALGVGGTFMVITMTGLRVARESAGANAPRLMAAMTAAFATGQIAGPLVVGMTNDFMPGLLAASVVLAVGALALAPSRDPGGARLA